jgi:hypothetical protein
MQTIAPTIIDDIFSALNSQLGIANGKPISLVVIGGTALAALGFVSRTTKDVDVLGELTPSEQPTLIKEIENFPKWLMEAAEKVRRDFDLPDNWLNFGPTSQVRAGLPDGLKDRLVEKKYGSYLQIYFCDRLDQIHFKLYASIDRGGYHVQDLVALDPTDEELLAASRWVLTQDVSITFRELLKDFLSQHGYENVTQEL